MDMSSPLSLATELCHFIVHSCKAGIVDAVALGLAATSSALCTARLSATSWSCFLMPTVPQPQNKDN